MNSPNFKVNREMNNNIRGNDQVYVDNSRFSLMNKNAK